MEFQVEPLKNPNVDELTPLGWFNKYKTKLVLGGGLIILIIGGLYFWLGNNGFSLNNVQVKVDGPTEISAGELATFKVTYKNNNKVSLSNAKLTFFFPDDAVVLKDDKVTDSHSVAIDLGGVTPGGGDSKEFKAYLVGDRGNVKASRAILTFSVTNINPTLEKEEQIFTTITALSIPLTLVAPPTAQSGQKITYILDYRNQSQEDKENLRINFKYPDGFHPENYSPKPSSGNNTWDIAKLAQGSGSRISVTGTITGSEGDSKPVSAVLQRSLTTADGDSYVDYEKTDASTALSNPTITAKIVVNDSKDYTAHLGDYLRYYVEVSNNSTYDILSLNLSVSLEGGMYDLSTVKSDGFLDSRTRIISWNSAVTPEFADFKPGQTVRVPFTVQLKSSFSGGGQGASDSSVKASAHLETDSVPAELQLDKLTADDQLVTRISTSAVFNQKILINDQLGVEGPFPLKVDKKTSFYVHWVLSNPSNTVSSAKVVGTLAPGVKWENVARVNGSQPVPTYNSRTNTVTWNFTELPGGVGTSFPAYEGVFKISITPSANQVGQTVPLLSAVNFSGTDSFTKEKIILNISDASSAAVSDSNESKIVQP